MYFVFINQIFIQRGFIYFNCVTLLPFLVEQFLLKTFTGCIQIQHFECFWVSFICIHEYIFKQTNLEEVDDLTSGE